MVNIVFSKVLELSLKNYYKASDKVLLFLDELHIGYIDMKKSDFFKERSVRFVEEYKDILTTEEVEGISAQIVKNKDNLAKLKTLLSNGNNPCFWYDPDSPSDMCMLYFLMMEINEIINCDIYTVELKRHIASDDGAIVSFNSFSNVFLNEHDICKYYEERKKYPYYLSSIYAQLWIEMIVANTDLRIIVNGSVVSVSPNFLDPLLSKEIQLIKKETNGERSVSRIVGELCYGNDKCFPKMGENWIRKRVLLLESDGLC